MCSLLQNLKYVQCFRYEDMTQKIFKKKKKSGIFPFFPMKISS